MNRSGALRCGIVGNAESPTPGSRSWSRRGRVAGVALSLALTAASGPAVSAAKKPDLRVTVISISATSAAGSGLEAADATKNRGQRRAPRSTTGFLLSTNERRDKTDLVLEGQRAVPKLKPGGKSQGKAHLRVAPSTPAGRYRLLACADIARRIAEADESNNCQAAAGFVEVIASSTGAIGRVAPAPTGPAVPTVPAAPTGLATDPPSTAPDTTPVVTGVAESGSTVELFASGNCTGPVVASGPAAAFASPGFEITVVPGVATRLSARAVNPAGGASACSAPVLYEAFGNRAAFRFTDLDLRDPHVWVNIGFGVIDITDTSTIGINDGLQENLTTDEDKDGFLDMSPVNLFDPFDQGAPTMPAHMALGAVCAAPPQVVCGPGASTITPTTATNASAGTCLDVLADTTTASYAPEVTTPTAPCFATDEMTVTLDLAGLPVTLEAMRVAATYDGDPATEETNGLVRGFLSEAVADATIIPAGYPLVENKPLSSLFPGGKDNPSPLDDLDTRAGVSGWWIYLNFTASRTPWVP